MRHTFFRVFTIISIWICLATQAQAISAKDQLGQLLERLRGMRANFEQVVLDESGQVVQKSTGLMMLQRPGKFRWETQQPSKQLLIASAGKLWIYDASLQQVTIQNVDTQGDDISPAFLLTGSIPSITRNFVITRVRPEVKSLGVWFRLTPINKQALFRSISLHFSDNQLVGMRLTDHLGQLSELSFTDIENNPALAPRVFRFVAPAGTDIIDQTRPTKTQVDK